MIRKEIIVLFLVTMLAMGCTDGDSSSTSTSEPFIGGTSSLDIRFEPGAPPDEVYAGNQYPFDIIVNIDNPGEYDVERENVRVKLVGVEPGLFGINELEKNPLDDMMATKKDSEGNIIEGSQSTVEYTSLNYQEDLDAAIDNLPIKAEICYKYGTKARSNICIKEDVLDNQESDICTVNEMKDVKNSAGPIQITELREAAQGTNKIVMSFKVTHLGSGEVYEQESFCPDERSSKNRVWLDINTDLVGLTCTGISGGSETSGVVNLGTTGERTVRCTMDVSNVVTDYEKSVSFELVYDYMKSIATSLTIRPNLG